MHYHRLDVTYENKHSYDIVIEDSFAALSDEIANLPRTYRRACIVSDSNVCGFYLDQLKEGLAGSFCQICHFIITAGETSKTLASVEALYEELVRERFDRHDLLIALGGGVVGDLTGFAAATYMRGIDYVQVPTSLLAQVDSSIGGKTGVDFGHYKNMVGAFKMPVLVYINISCLKTLSPDQFTCGMGEVIKHGLIRDISYYQWLKSSSDKIKARDLRALAQMVYVSTDIKRRTCQVDPKEEGIRAHLNFGHTIGHAVEKLSDFRLYHGQCVSIGSAAALCLSRKLGGISQIEMEDAIRTLALFDLPVSLDPKSYPQMTRESILSAIKSDKKMDGNRIKFVYLRAIGQADTYMDFTDDDLRGAIDFVLSSSSLCQEI